MCELFGVSTRGKINVKGYLAEFFSHSGNHPNGWGIAQFYGNAVSLEKEPVTANKSPYLRERLRSLSDTYDMIAHIRLATRGCEEYVNTHPFVMRDNRGRAWTLAHNGTIFNYPALDGYFSKQKGRTDSERVLLYFVDRIDAEQENLNRPLDASERFLIIDSVVSDMSVGNKLNFLLYDGEFLYVHCNYANSLYSLQLPDAVLFATVPLSGEKWKPVEFTTLLAYRSGHLVMKGNPHGHEYRDNDKDSRLLFLDYSSL